MVGEGREAFLKAQMSYSERYCWQNKISLMDMQGSFHLQETL